MATEDSDADLQAVSPEEEKVLHDLFLKLDINKDGKIDMNDLTKAMETMQLPQVPGHVKQFFEKYDKDSDGQINFDEFVKYVKEHEKDLMSYFKNIDTNSDGFLEPSEIVESFKKMGVHIEKAEAENLLRRMDRDGTLKIDWNEWREYLILTPSQSIHDILHYWRHSSLKLDGICLKICQGEAVDDVWCEPSKIEHMRGRNGTVSFL